ncbi:MAG: N-acetylmuramoyl-L-alanine amidase [Clostridia bacterium]|nr:N-acetylmuramoyl-L-alanine amidase [Clostridia bacterium]
MQAKSSKTQRPLEGRVICLDPGHQSKMSKAKVPIAPNATTMMPDYAIGTRGIKSRVFEYTITLKVAKILEQELTKLGAKVVLTRQKEDELVGSIKRAEIANDAKADIFIRIHCDGLDDSTVHGVSVLYPGDKYIKDKAMLEKSLALSQALLKNTVSATKAKSRGLSKRNDLVGFNYSKVPCTLIEMGFMTNKDEDLKLNSEDYQKKLVQGMVNGILEYYKALTEKK